MKHLEQLGYDNWLNGKTALDKTGNHEIARVISVHKDSCIVTKGEEETLAECSGNFLYSVDSVLDLPTVGDWIYADFYDDDSHAIIHGVVTRKSILKRKKAGRSVDFQLIAANIDVAFILQPADSHFSLRRIERYLAMVVESKITPVILLSKCDLISRENLEKIKLDIQKITPETTVISFSNLTGENLQQIQGSLLKGKTYCLLGLSGAGKTTLLNTLMGIDHYKTQSVSDKKRKGRHTTSNRELVRLADGAIIVDTPGMRELGNISLDRGIEQTFSEISELSRNCKFKDCSHASEKGCAVLAAVTAGEISEDRLKSYHKLKKETVFNQMSYSQRRTRDREFGKMVKSAKKAKHRG